MAKGRRRNPGPPVRRLTRQEYIDRIEQNGITLKELEKNWHLGYEQGKKEGQSWAFDAAYGSVMLALKREFGFGHDRLGRVAMAAAAIQVEYLTTDEMYEQLKKECGVELPRMRDIIDGGGV